MARKVKITRLPNNVSGKKTGDQHNYALYRPEVISESYEDEPKLNNTIKESDFEGAPKNVEVEDGEYIFSPENMTLKKAVGKRHSKGGIDVALKRGDFVFSRDKSMKDENGKTPADIIKKVKLNNYKANLASAEKSNDPYSQASNELNIENGLNQIGKTALNQEAIKGFPDGIPDASIPYLQQIMPQAINTGDKDGQQVAKYGGLIKAKDGKSFNLFDVIPWLKSNTDKGWKTPTGKDSRWDPNKNKNYLSDWEKIISGISKMDNKKAQYAIYDYIMDHNPDAIRNMWSEWGLNKKAYNDPRLSKYDTKNLSYSQLRDLREAYADGYFGNRTLSPTNLQPSFSKGIPDYFSPQMVPTNKLTSFNPNLPKPLDIPKTQTEVNNSNENDKPISFDNSQNYNVEPSFWDQLSVFNRATEPINVQYPQLFRYNSIVGNPTFMDNRAQIQNMKGISAQGNDVIQNTANGQVARANMLANQSRLFDPINQSFENMNNQNVSIANQWEQYRDQTKNQEALTNLQAFDRYAREVDATKSALDTAKSLKKSSTIEAGQNMTNNMITQMALAERYPQYRFNLSSPIPTMNFIPGQGSIFDNTSGSKSDDNTVLSTVQGLIDQGFSRTDAIALAKLMLDRKSETRLGMSPTPSRTTVVSRE